MSRIKVYGVPMPKHLTKISKFGGQYRLTIPKLLVEELKWKGVEYVFLERHGSRDIRIRRFIDGESLRTERKKDRPGSD